MLSDILASKIRALFRNRVYTVRNGLAKGMRRKGGLGFLPRGMTAEQRFLLNQNLEGLTVYDIGGWEGVFTLFFSRAVGLNGGVVTFEPNPQNQAIIQKNLSINQIGNVTIVAVALGREARQAKLAIPRISSGLASVVGGSRYRYIESQASEICDIQLDTLDHQVAERGLPDPDFVKIDVEGLELDVLMGMQKTVKRAKPHLFIEVHECGEDGGTGNARSVVEWLLKNGYSVFHVENEDFVRANNAEDVVGGHIFCE